MIQQITPKSPKARADFYVYQQDLLVINEVFDLAKGGKALAGQQMRLTKTEWVREVIHKAVERDLLPLFSRIQVAGGQGLLDLTSPAEEQKCPS